MTSLADSEVNSQVDDEENIKKTGFFKALFSKQTGAEKAFNILFQTLLGALAVFPLIIYWAVQYKHFKADEEDKMWTIRFGKKKSEKDKTEKTAISSIAGDTDNDSGKDSKAKKTSKEDESKSQHSKKSDFNSASDKEKSESNVTDKHHSDPRSSLSASQKAGRKPNALDYEIATAIKSAGDDAEKVIFNLQPTFGDLAKIMKDTDDKLYAKLCTERKEEFSNALGKRCKALGLKEEQINDIKMQYSSKKGNVYLNNLPAEIKAFYKRIDGTNPYTFNNQDELFNLLIEIANEVKEDTGSATLSIDLMPKDLENNSFFWFMNKFMDQSKKLDDLGNNGGLQVFADLTEQVKLLLTDKEIDMDDKMVIHLNEEQTNELLKAKGYTNEESFDSQL